MTELPEPTARSGRSSATGSRAAVAALCFAGIVVAMMQTMVVPLLPDLPERLDADLSDTSWALTVTLLVGAVNTPLSGRLADMYGKRRVIFAGLAWVVVGCVVCALSNELAPFLVGRGLQGLGLGTIPLGTSIIADIVPAERLPAAIGAMSGSMGIGNALGLPFGAFLAHTFDWHVLFVVSGVLATVAMVAIALTVPRAGQPPPGGRFDVVGAIGLLAVLVSLLIPLSKAAQWDRWVIPFVVAFVVLTPAWVWYELRSPEPLIDLRSAAYRPVMLTNLASIAVGFSFYGLNMIAVQLLMAPPPEIGSAAHSMVQTGLILVPIGLMMLTSSTVGARLNEAIGPPRALAVGIVLLSCAFATLLVVITVGWVPWWIVAAVGAIAGFGLGISYAVIPAQIMRSVPSGQWAQANGVNALMRAVGTTTSTAFIGMILAWSVPADSVPAGVPAIGGYLTSTAVCLVGCVIATTLALAIDGNRRR